MQVVAKTSNHRSNIGAVLGESLYADLFRPQLELVPQLNETYELELAFYESRLLDDEAILRNGAYFASVDRRLTRHFLMCSGEPVHLPQHSSSRLRSFFQTNQFKTGYGTHGLFPYRGKFHPQMIKGLLNVMGVKPGETVADPMMGSGTVLIEACLMGINSTGLDASPFCKFMTQAKVDGLTVPLAPVRGALEAYEAVYAYFMAKAGRPIPGRKMRSEMRTGNLFDMVRDSSAPYINADQLERDGFPLECFDNRVYDFLLLAYLDSAGYSERSNRKPPIEQFRAILERYLFVSEKIQRVLSGTEHELGKAVPLEGDAREMPMETASLDGILFSPPYSFAIDYLDNDSFHLDFLGVDTDSLRDRMIGLRGRTKQQKYENYVRDMDTVLAECARTLRPGRLCTVVVGTNNNQLSKILDVHPNEVQGIDQMVVALATPHGFQLIRKIERQITGMANTMRSEYIVMLQRL